MELTIAVVLAVAAAIFIGYPFYQSRKQKFSFESNHRAEELENRKAEIYAAIKDIEFDYQMGKLSEEDYLELREQYKSQAVDLLKKIDVEEQGKQRRMGKKVKAAEIKFCVDCGMPVLGGDRFCTNCGTRLA